MAGLTSSGGPKHTKPISTKLDFHAGCTTFGCLSSICGLIKEVRTLRNNILTLEVNVAGRLFESPV